MVAYHRTISIVQTRNVTDLRVDLPPTLPPIISDTANLGPVVVELLNNACKYTQLVVRLSLKVGAREPGVLKGSPRGEESGEEKGELCNSSPDPNPRSWPLYSL